MITRCFCSKCGKTFLDKKECAAHEERCPAPPKVDGIHWTGSLEMCEGLARWFIIPHRVWLQYFFNPTQELWAVTDMNGNEFEDMVYLNEPTILSNLSVIDHSVRFQMFTLMGKSSEDDVALKMRALAKDYLTEVQNVVKDLLPATKEIKGEKKKASKAGFR